jgi:apolipoprotein N-acyltransferase
MRTVLRPFALFATTAIMLTLAQPPIGWWPLAWIGYVPFVLACSTAEKPFRLCLPAWIIGACFWLGNIYWMSFVTVAGWIAFCLYTALLWPILALSLKWCISKKIPLFIAVPILVVGIEQTQGLFLGGFYWLYLAHSQYSNTSLIQIADVFGVSGVSFLVAMVNGMIAEIFIVRRSLVIVRNSILAVIVIVGALGYGHWRINQSGKYITNGPVVAAVQTNIPQSVKQSFAAEQQILDGLLDQSNQCLQSRPQLIVWPETMVQAILEPMVLRLLDEYHQYKQFDEAIRGLATKGVYLLVGAYGGSPRIEENFDIRMAQKFNAAFLYQPDGNQAPEKYYKIHLVPFGEYLPFEDIPVIHNLMLKMTPYDFDYTLDAGKELTAFEMKPANSNPDAPAYNFSVLICYEDAVPGLARRFVLDKDGRKRIDWLINISNDGWFVRFHNDKVFTSSELAQHTVVCAFRAVENRVAVLRSVNTGISCIIDPLGRIKNDFKSGNLPKNALDRQGVTGWFADVVPIDSRITTFSKYGQWMDFSCQLVLAGIIMAQLLERFFFKKQNKTETAKK